MRRVILAATAAALMAGSAVAQTATPQAAAPSAQRGPSVQPLAEKNVSAAVPPRTDRVCTSEPIANSRLKTKKVCISRAEHERIRNARKLMIRENLESGGVQACQSVPCS